MESTNLKEAIAGLNVLKKDAQETMKKGLPFVLASVVIWGLILVVQSLDLDISVKNMCTFVCCVLLMPLAILFSKIVGADIFRKTPNPVSKLALLNTLNQFLYILIVMWAFSRAPEYMVMVYAMVFGAHLLPFSLPWSSARISCLSAGRMTARLTWSSPLWKQSARLCCISFWAALLWPLSSSSGKSC